MVAKSITVGIIGETNCLILVFYVLMQKQRIGCGIVLLPFAVGKCTDTSVTMDSRERYECREVPLSYLFMKTGRINLVFIGFDIMEFVQNKIFSDLLG